MSRVKESLVSIANEVLEDVRKEAEAVILDSERKAKENLIKAKEKAQNAYSEILNESKDKIEAERRKLESLIEVEMRNRLLSAKEELVNAAFAKALVKLTEFVGTANYHEHLCVLIQEAVKRVSSKSLIVFVNSKDHEWLARGNLKRLSRKTNTELVLSDTTDEWLGGCKVQTIDGKKVYDNTLENRFQQLKPMLRAEVAKILFENEA
jgi:V/A-type H+-transporting ATPase subunit E